MNDRSAEDKDSVGCESLTFAGVIDNGSVGRECYYIGMNTFIQIILVLVFLVGGPLFIGRSIMRGYFNVGIYPAGGTMSASQSAQPFKFWFFIAVFTLLSVWGGLGSALLLVKAWL